MTAEELFDELIMKYGKNFNWRMISFSDKSFTEELNKELGEDRIVMPIFSVAKCETNNDVLYLIDENDYRMCHLLRTTFSPAKEYAARNRASCTNRRLGVLGGRNTQLLTEILKKSKACTFFCTPCNV